MDDDLYLCLHPFVGTGPYCMHIDVESQGDDHPCMWERSDHSLDTPPVDVLEFSPKQDQV